MCQTIGCLSNFRSREMRSVLVLVKEAGEEAEAKIVAAAAEREGGRGGAASATGRGGG